MEKIKKNLGFGFMRLPMQGEEVDLAQTQQMVDAFLAAGFNYFDTAHGYLDGRSETALKACLTSRYPREDYVLTNKLTANFFKTEADIRPFFESQLAACGVDDFDFYLMHAQSMKNFEHFKACRAYETAFALKAEGKVRHVGISFHDSAEMLDRILTEYPQLEAVQLQFNYVDYDDPARRAEPQVLRGLPEARQAGHRDGAGQGRQSRRSAGGRRGGAGRPARRQQRELRHPLCGGLPGR